MDGSQPSVTTCGSMLQDSGGGANPYNPNENITLTICSDGSEGTHIQLVFSGTDIAPDDQLCFFDGQTTAAPMLGCASDFDGEAAFIMQATAANPTGCLTLLFTTNGTNEGAGFSAAINCIPSCQLIESVLVSSDPPSDPLDNGWIDICPGDEVQFEGTVVFPQNGLVYNQSISNSTIEWSFGDGTFAEGLNVSHRYDEPGGYVVQLMVTDQFGCKNSNFISQRVRVAPRPIFNLGGDVPTQICTGDTIHLNSAVNLVDDEFVVSTLPSEASFQAGAVRSDSLALPDGNGVSYETSVSFTDFSPGQVLENISDLERICVNMEHSWMRDLQIMLTCPNGQSVVLHNHPGQEGGEVFLGTPIDNDGLNPTPGIGADYCWTPDATMGTWIEYANAHENPFSFDPLLLPPGDYNSFEPLENLVGCPLNGEWTITVTDLWPIDNGFIFSWGILFNDSLYHDLEKFTPQLVDWNWALAPYAFFQTPDSISAAPQSAGNMGYDFMVIDEFGCQHDTMINLTVLPPNHPDCYNCTELLTPAPDTIICLDQELQIDVSPANPQPPTTSVTFESFDNKKFNANNHPPANPMASIIEVNSVFPNTLQNPFSDIESVCVDISTPAAGGIRLYLHAPNGSVLTLSTNNGGQNDNYTQTCFTPNALTTISLGNAPFTGNWQPEGNWNNLSGTPVNGEWWLEVSDVSNTTGQNVLNWWSISFKSHNDVTWQWSPATNLSCSDCPNPVFTAAQTTNLTVDVSDVHNCSEQASMTVEVLPAFPAPTVTFEVVAGGTLVFNWDELPGGYDYLVNVDNTGWVSPNNGHNSHLLTGFSNGDTVDFQVRVDVPTDACEVNVEHTVAMYVNCDEFSAFPSNAPPYQVQCPNACDAAVPISAQNGVAPFTYTATHDSGMTWTQNNGNFTGLCPGNYTIVVEDAVGCVDQVQFTVTEPLPISINTFESKPVTCFGGSDGEATAQAFGGTVVAGVYSYEWSDPLSQITPVAVGLTAGTYTVTVTDDNGCTETANVDITQPLELMADANGSNILCFGEATGSGFVSATGGNGGYQFDWGGVGSAPNASFNEDLPAGMYTITVTDSKGCTTTADLTLTQPASPVSVIVQQTLLGCDGQNNSEATATASGGTPGYSYAWSNNQNSNVATNLGNQTYTVTVTDGNGCTASGSVDITDLDPYELNIQFTEPSCFGTADGQMSVLVVSGGAATDPDCTGCTFLWSNGGTTQFINGLQGGQNYAVTITDQQGCTGTISRFLPNPDPIEFEIVADEPDCFGSNNGSATVQNITGAFEPVAYQWDLNAKSQTTPTAGGLTAGIYSVTLTDDHGCTAAQMVEIGQPDEIVVAFDITDNPCFGDASGRAVASASGGSPGYTFAWATGETTPDANNLAAGQYALTVTDAIGCTTEAIATIGEPEPVNAIVEATDVTCFGDRNGMLSITPQGGTPPFTYSTDGQNYFGSNTLIGLEAGNYSVFIKDGNGCISQEEGIVGSPDEFIIAINDGNSEVNDLTIQLGDSVTVWVVNEGMSNFLGSEVIWDPAYCGAVFCKDGTSDCDFDKMTCNPIIIKPTD
ncbi:MAG: PKD domain-containing protein, partial [Bacteroidetes bacterium]